MKKPRALKSKNLPVAAPKDLAPPPLEIAIIANASVDTSPTTAQKPAKPWFLYLIECQGGSYYAGITTDVAKRYQTHKDGKGAKYTRARKPVRLLGAREYANHSEAAKAEWAIKQLPKVEKLGFLRALVESSADENGGDTLGVAVE